MDCIKEIGKQKNMQSRMTRSKYCLDANWNVITIRAALKIIHIKCQEIASSSTNSSRNAIVVDNLINRFPISKHGWQDNVQYLHWQWRV